MITNYFYENGHSYFIIKYKGKEFLGKAKCHIEDMDMESERIGLTIAEIRAQIKMLCFIRDNEIKPKLKALSHLQNNIQMSKYHNPNSHETQMLNRQVRIAQEELAAVNNEIADSRKFLNDYIQGKEKLWQKIRRTKNNNQ